MSKRMKLAAENVEMLLEALTDSNNCAKGCQCLFCRIFEDGYNMGRDDAITTIAREVEAVARRGK